MTKQSVLGIYMWTDEKKVIHTNCQTNDLQVTDLACMIMELERVLNHLKMRFFAQAELNNGTN